MSAKSSISETPPVVLHFASILRKLDDEDFYDFCQANSQWRIERTQAGDLVIMPPTGGKTSIRNFELAGQFGNWAKADGTGQAFDSSTVFRLPNGAMLSPDLSWVHNERWQRLTDKQQNKFPPLCPDFVVELRSLSDTLPPLQTKMREYIANGAALAWLIDPLKKRVHVYRPPHEIEILNDPAEVSGAPVLPGFILKPQELWD